MAGALRFFGVKLRRDHVVAADRGGFDLNRVSAPSMVVSGAHDLDGMQRMAAFVAAQIPGAAHRRLDWAGHLPSIEDPVRLMPVLLGFLSESAAR